MCDWRGTALRITLNEARIEVADGAVAALLLRVMMNPVAHYVGSLAKKSLHAHRRGFVHGDVSKMRALGSVRGAVREDQLIEPSNGETLVRDIRCRGCAGMHPEASERLGDKSDAKIGMTNFFA